MQPLKDILKFIGGWPLIDKSWNEDEWEWGAAILKLREYVSKRSNNIFSKQKEPNNKDDTVS